MRRREFITLVGAALGCPLAVSAQQALPVIGYLSGRSRERDAPFIAAFRQGLKDIGFVEGQNVVMEFRWADGRNNRLPELADDLVRNRVSVIAATSGSTLAAKAATSTIPIVFSMAADPVALNVVPSLHRPAGNITGVTTLGVEVGPKRLGLLHEMLPNATIVALLVNPTGFNAERLSRDLEGAAQALGLKAHVLNASREQDFDRVFTDMGRLRVEGLVIGADPFFNAHLKELAALSLRYRMPAVYQFHEFTAVGGLMSYGSNVIELFHMAGVYAGRVLKGEKPADLPVHQATKVELIINLKTASALGLTLPLSLRGRADEVIE
jgi:putative ABC transport system substrate-binding protein